MVQVYAEGADSVSSEPPSVFFMFSPLIGFALASRTAGSRSVAEAKSGPRNGAYSTRTLGADLTEQILANETIVSPKPFFACGDLQLLLSLAGQPGCGL